MSQEKTPRMEPWSSVLAIFSSITVEVLCNPYDSKASKEQLIEIISPDSCLNNFFEGVDFYHSDF